MQIRTIKEDQQVDSRAKRSVHSNALAVGTLRQEALAKDCIAIMTIQKMRQYHLEIVLDRLPMLKKDRQSLNRDHRLKYVYGT